MRLFDVQDDQRGWEPDPDQGQQGHHAGAAQRVQGLLQPLRQIQVSNYAEWKMTMNYMHIKFKKKYIFWIKLRH